MSAMVRVLKVHRSCYYDWLKRPVRDDHSAERAEMAKIQEEADGSYGVRRMAPELRSLGFPVGKKLVARLMREEGVQGRIRRTKPYGKAKAQEVPPMPNDLDRAFAVDAPNQVWATDITYIWTRSGWVYLVVILDLHARVAVGWDVSTCANSELVINALLKAVFRRRPGRGVLLHSDQGCQYTSHAWKEVATTMGFRLSMSGRGQCWDNAPVESWNGILKRESRVTRTLLDGIDEVREVLFPWIEGWYNTRRRHSTLGYLSPAEFERKWAA